MNEQTIKEYHELTERYALVALGKMCKPTIRSFQDLLQEGMLILLQIEKEYRSDKGASFKTFFIGRLLHHYSDIVSCSYRRKKNNCFDLYLKRSRYNASINDPVEINHVKFVLKQLTLDELEYVEAMVSLEGEKRASRRKVARKMLGITYNREVELRNSVWDKVRK